MLWIITVVGTLFPALYAANVDVSFDMNGMASAVNKAGLFKDLFYVVVVIALLGLSNIIYDLLIESRPHAWVSLIMLLAVAYFLYILLYGTGAFSHMANVDHLENSGATHLLSEKEINHNVNVIWLTMAVGLATELVLAFRERDRR